MSQNEINLINDVPLTSKVTFSKDVTSLAINLFISVVILSLGFIASNDGFLLLPSLYGLLYFVIGIVLLVYGLVSVRNVYNSFNAARIYHKAENELEGLYLRRNEPVCPYLKVVDRKFKCLIEFQEEFNIASDLPKCHNEMAFKKHWEEKASNVFAKAQTVEDRNLAGYLTLLGRVKYEPAIPFLIEIFDVPQMTKNRLFVFERANGIDENALKNEYVDNFINANKKLQVENLDQEKAKLMVEFDVVISTLTKSNLILVDNGAITKAENYSDPNFINKWKIYGNPLIKQYTLASLTGYEDPKLVPKLLSIYIEATDSKIVTISKSGLLKLSDYLEEPLLEYFNDPTIPDDKKVILIDLASKIDSQKLFEVMKRFSESNNETLSYYAISALGTYGKEGIREILDIMANKPSDLDIDAGRSSLVENSEFSFKEISSYLDDKDKLSDEFKQILSSILEELDHVTIKKYFNELPSDEQDHIDEIYEKHNLLQPLDYLLE